MKNNINRKTILILLILSTISVIFYYESSDLILHSEFALKIKFPYLFNNDILLNENFRQYPSFFSYFLSPFIDSQYFNVILQVITGIIKIALILSIFFLSKKLFENERIALISAASVIFAKPALGATMFGCDYLLPRTLILPIIIICFYFAIKGLYFRSFFILGILANIHVLSSFFFLPILTLGIFLTYPNKTKLMEIIKSLPLFLIGSSPILIDKFFFSPAVETASRELIMIRNPYFFLNTWYVKDLLIFLPFILLFYIAIYYKEKNKTDKLVLNCSFVTVGIMIINYVLNEILKLNFELQLYRVSKYIILFSILYGSWFAYTLYNSKSRDNKRIFKIFAIFIVISMIFFPHVDDLNYYRKHSIFYSYKDEISENWMDIEKWAKENTNIDDIFVVPPKCGTFRIHSERGIVGSWKDGGAQLHFKNYSEIWWMRMEDLGYKKIYDGEQDYISLLPPEVMVKYGYDTLTTKDLYKIARKYNASYIVVESPHELGFPVEYANEHFKIYKVMH